MQKKFFCLPILLVCFSLCLHPDEVQVSFCDDPPVTEIDAALEARLGIFPDYPGFSRARVWRVDEHTYNVEILCTENGTLVRKTLTLDETGFADLRTRVAGSLALHGEAKHPDQKGRTALLTATTLYSLSLYGPLFASMTGMQDAQSITATESVMGGAGFFVPFGLTRDKRVTESAATAYIDGTMIGAEHGALLMLLVYGENIASPQDISGTVLAFSLAEGIGGYFLADAFDPPAGLVDNMSALSFWGTLWGAGISYLTDIDDPQVFGGIMLTGSLAGMGTGYALSAIEDYSRGDAMVQNDVTALGAFLTPALCDLAAIREPKPLVGAALAGSAAGTLLGYQLIKGRNFTDGQGALITLGEYAGFLVGSGIMTYFENEHGFFIPAIGGAIGFGVVYNLFRDAALPVPGNASWGFSVSPFVGQEWGELRPGAADGQDALRDLLRNKGVRVAAEYRFD